MALNHPNIVKLHHFTETAERFELFMEYAGWSSDYLAQKILNESSPKPIKNNEKLRVWALDILQAISYLHSKGVIHQDIKIENVLISQEYEDQQCFTAAGDAAEQAEADEGGVEYPLAKLCDFGLCALVDPERKVAFMKRRVGTNGY